MKKIIISALAGLLIFSCQNHKEDGHAHDAEGNHLTESASAETPRLDYTIWTDKTELFTEFPAFIVGKQSKLISHFTVMDKHQAITKGSVTASLIVNGKGVRKTVEIPSSPGIFSPILQPTQVGVGQLQFLIKTDDYTETITIDNIKVYANLAEAQKDLATSEEEGESITFLKEQAWKMPFQTAKAEEKEVFQGIATSGIWQTAPSNTRNVVANANGKVTFANNNIIAGKKVRQGETIMTISSKGMAGNVSGGGLETAKIDLQQAKAEYDRKKDLFNDKIISKSNFEQVEQKYLVAKAKYNALQKGYSSSGYSAKTIRITAPISGFLSEINIANGGFANEGMNLFTVSKSQSSVLKIQVSPANATKLNNIQNVWYKTANNKWADMKSSKGNILSVNKIVSAENPNLNVFAQINSAVQMPQGSFTEVNISTGTGKKGVVIPSSALLENYGKYSVIVQLGGESFEERNVVIGSRNGDNVAITKGLKQGEMVVTTGAYQVKMQSMSGKAPAHGHAH